MTIVFMALLQLAAAKSFSEHPIDQVVKLISGLKANVLADGKAEQQAFDKYACWCEKTLERKASDISSAKELIAETETLIKKLKGEIASHGAEIEQLNKDIAKNIAAQKEATSVRNKENQDYASERSESEQCLGAMEAAIKVLTGAGAGKGFLDTSTHAAELLSVAAQIRTVFRAKMPSSISEQDLALVKSFAAKPEDFMQTHSSAMSAAQVGQNPFGDYAPQSTQIQGILKGMYDAFTADLEKDNANEAESQKSFEALIATKKQEQQTLQDTLQQQESDSAAKTKHMKESQVLKDDTAEQLAADEAFFADTKDACKSKASEWAVRTRLRTEELAGMEQAIQILSSKDAKATFQSSATTFLQMASVQEHRADSVKASKAYGELKKLATKYKSAKVAKIAAAVQMGGHFDKVMTMIDSMIALLRKEEAEDIVHRDMCENDLNANANELADLDHAIKKAQAMIDRMERTSTQLGEEINQVKADISATKGQQSDLLDFRNEEERDFRQALKDDTVAVGLIREAIAALSKFYKNNKIPMELVQKKAPEYENDPDKAPSTWEGGDNYGGRKSENGGIVAILSMLAEDLEKEIAEGRGDDKDAQAKYEKQNGALQNTLDSQEETKAGLEEQKAGVEAKIDAAEAYKKGKQDDSSAGGDTKKALATDCEWVKDHFKDRRDKRKDEIDGLVDAKAFLAGGGDSLA
jgi:hypothetical protein